MSNAPQNKPAINMPSTPANTGINKDKVEPATEKKADMKDGSCATSGDKPSNGDTKSPKV